MPQQSLPTYQITEANLVYVVWVDELVHTTEHPFCLDLEGCPCHEDSNLVREYVTKPLDNGLLTNAEALRLYFGTQLVSTQDTTITDEPNITDRRNEWNGYEQEMAWEAVEEEWRRATNSRDLEPEDLLHTDEYPYCDDPACWRYLCERDWYFLLAEMEEIMSNAVDNKDADELGQDKREWLIEHL